MKKIHSIAAIIIFFLIMRHEVNAISFEFQEPEKEELLMEKSPANDDKGAIILLNFAYINDESYESYITNYVRIKIFNSKAFDYANIQLPYTTELPITKLKARIINKDGKIINVDKRNIFDKEIIKGKGLRIKAKAFTFPALQPGCIIEYIYTQRRYPLGIIWLEIQKDLFILKLEYRIKPRSSYFLRWFGLNIKPFNIKPIVDNNEILIKGENIYPFEEEEFSPAEFDLRTTIFIIYTSKKYENIDEYWSEYSKRIKKEYDNFINHSKKWRKKIEFILNSNESEAEKLKKIYYYIQREFKNLDYNAKDKEILNKKLNNIDDIVDCMCGNENDLNLLMVSAAKLANLESYIGLVADKRKGHFYKEFLYEGQLNSVIALIKINNNFIYLSPGSYGLSFGILPWYYANEPVLILENEYKFGVTNYVLPEDNMMTEEYVLQVNDDGYVSGESKIEYFAVEAMQQRQFLINQDAEAMKKAEEIFIESGIPNPFISNFSMNNLKDASNALVFEYQFRYQSSKISDNRFYLRLPSFVTFADDFFSFNKRLHPLCIGDMFRIISKYEITVPASISIEELPKINNFSIDEINYEISYERKDKQKIVIIRKIDFKFHCIKAERYQILRNFWDRIKKNEPLNFLFYRE